MNIPSNINNFRSTNYDNDTIFLNEYFHDIENITDMGEYLLFFRLVQFTKSISKSIGTLTNPTTFSYVNNNNGNFVYNRYVNNICIDKNNGSNTYNYIDNGIYNNSIYNKQINLSYRPLQLDKYINSILTGPCDGRYKGLGIDNSVVRMYGYNSNIKLSDYINNTFTNGAGYYIDILPQDYKGIFIPYAGHLVNFKVGKSNITLIIESDYFIAPDVHERSYLSVVNGHTTSQGTGVGVDTSSYDPDILKIQDNGKLIYCLNVAFPSTSNIVYRKKLGVNQWMEQGTEIMYIDNVNNNKVNVLLFINRPIDYVNDIKTYNKYPMMTYLRCRDIIGILN